MASRYLSSSIRLLAAAPLRPSRSRFRKAQAAPLAKRTFICSSTRIRPCDIAPQAASRLPEFARRSPAIDSARPVATPRRSSSASVNIRFHASAAMPSFASTDNAADDRSPCLATIRRAFDRFHRGESRSLSTINGQQQAENDRGRQCGSAFNFASGCCHGRRCCRQLERCRVR